MMASEAVPMIAYEQETAGRVEAVPHLLVYGWIYFIFFVLTGLAVYVMFSFEQAGM